ncbi:hypothetical protein HIMB100_00023030 [SAR116 cluster alpha proteobacterium HIMB100]|nr:hypothetical protein HIMB100_00023030 [SAR116 cluster alpha proteobacterium HIMB100]
MIVGLDFDNTIACYDLIFHEIAVEKGLIDKSVKTDKTSVRDNLRANGKEEDWIKLQGFVYGRAMPRVKPYKGVIEFLVWAKKNNHTCKIISHKTKHPYSGPRYDLHNAANKWIKTALVFQNELMVQEDEVFFHQTKTAKIEQIKAQNCDIFIDDLPEILLAEAFPDTTRGILFDPMSHHREETNLERIKAWKQLETFLN